LFQTQALLELKGRLLVEAALEEVVSLVAAHLDLLQVGDFAFGLVCCCLLLSVVAFVLLQVSGSVGQPGGGTPRPAAGAVG
jgi:hypothetical protein